MAIFSKSKLLKVAESRGYYNERAVCDGLSQVLGISSNSIRLKIRDGRFTKEECEVIGSFFEMTMKEYYDVFMYGLFQLDGAGNYRCHIDNLLDHLHPPEPPKPKESKQKTKKRKREDIIAEIENI